MAAAKEIILITGANKGLGFESARQLAKLGFKVLLGARDAAAGAAATAKLTGEGLDVEFLQIDVASDASVAAAAASVGASYGRVDVLINNAGIANGFANDVTALDVAQLTAELNVNFLGVVRVTNAFLPLVRKALKVPRIVNLSTILASHAEHEDSKSPIFGAVGCAGYNASKAALNMYTQNLAHALKASGVKVNAVHPGWVKTDMGGEAAPLSIVEGVETTVKMATIGADGPTGGFFHKGVHMRW